MTASGHALLGAIIAAKTGDPLLAGVLAFGSHIVADILPHWDAGTHREDKTNARLFWEAAADVILGIILVIVFMHFFAPTVNLAYTFFIVFISQGLDWITAPYLFLQMKFPPFSWVYKFQSEINNKLDKPWGIITQIAFVLFVFLLFFVF